MSIFDFKNRILTNGGIANEIKKPNLGNPLPTLPSGVSFLKKQTKESQYDAVKNTSMNSTPSEINFNKKVSLNDVEEDVISGTPDIYADLIREKSKQYGVSPSILSSLINKESLFDTKSQRENTKEKSYGLAQINTLVHPVTKNQAMDPSFAIDFAAKRLASMIQKYGLYDGIQAYNTPGAIGSKQLIDYADEILKNAKRDKPIQQTSNILNKTYSSIQNKLPSILTSLGNKTTDFGGKTKYEKFHPGIDIANAKGTPIKSTIDGVVVGIKSGLKKGDQGYGNQIMIKDKDGNTHTYSHLNTINAKIGERVLAGQAIATMGDSGSTYSLNNGDSSHLDYRITDAYNKYINPYQYFNKKIS
jgi:murein DD-endopeptidase MepM/ murein hydrolase activator NlpD